MLLGSAAAAGRRDEWSDHDFFVLAQPGSEASVRDVEDWLPEPERLVLVAREGEIGFVALYNDGHVFEFAAATAGELAGAMMNDAAILFDDGPVAPLVDAARARVPEGWAPDAANDARLVLVKLLIGVGRGRRGEVINAGQFVRTWAINHLIRAIRARMPLPHPVGDSIDPVRRFERDYPELGARVARALEGTVEEAARAVFALLRDTLEPGWDEFPSRAADVVADRLGWAPSRS